MGVKIKKIILLLIVTIFVLSLITSGNSLSKINYEDYSCESGFYCVYKFENGNVSLLEKHLIGEKEDTDRIEKLILLAREKKKRIDEGKASFITTMGGCGSIPTDYCTITQNTVFEPGIYNLPHGISINANNVTLDCNGAVLKGAADQGISEGGIDISRSDVEVRNCIIQNFGNGMFVLGNNNKFINNGISGNLDSGIIFVDAVSNNITGNIFHSNKNAVNINGNSKNILLTENIFYDNERGVYISPPSQDTKLLGNNICKSSYLDIFLTNSTAKRYGNENSCDKPGDLIWFWDDELTVGCSYTCDPEECDKLEPASKKGFRLLNYTDDNWRVDFLGWVKDSKHSEYNLCYPYNFNMNISYESFAEYELNVSAGKDKLKIAYTYLLSGGQENSVYFSTKVFIYNFGRGVWEGVYDKPRNGGVSTEDVVDIYLSKERIQNGKIRLRAVQKNIDVNESAGSCSVVFLGGEKWSGTISLDRFTHQFCSTHCSNGIKDGDETGNDCGGSCPPCVSCDNGIQDSNEEGVDCGGVCTEECKYLKIIALPLNDVSGQIWTNQSDFDAKVDEQLNYFIDELPLRNCSNKVKIIKLDITTQSLSDFNCSKECGKRLNPFVKQLGYKPNRDYDYIIGFVRECGGRGCSSHQSAWVEAYSAFPQWYQPTHLASHELGHIFGLEDEYCSNQAGSNDARCNDGGEWWWMGPIPIPPMDINYLNSELGCNASIGDCCSDCSSTGNPFGNSDYFVCCEGNNNSRSGKAIMSYTDAAGPRYHDTPSLEHLSKQKKLQCQTYELKSLGIPDLGEKQRILDINFLIYSNHSVEKRWINLFDGEPLPFFNKGWFFNLSIEDNHGNILFNYTFDVDFYYEGPMLKNLDYSDIIYPYNEIALRIPYSEDMYKIELLYNGSIIFSEILNFCNYDGICNGSENYLSCWQDCKSYSKDDLCLNYSGDGCDPDCAELVDADCYKIITINQGWNLISIPLNLSDRNITSVFTNTNITIFSYKNNSWFIPTEIDNKLGYWVKVDEDINVTIVGNEIDDKSINLSEGWNLVGYPYLEEKEITELFENATVFAYNRTWLSYIPNRPFNSLQTLKPGYGYWAKI